MTERITSHSKINNEKHPITSTSPNEPVVDINRQLASATALPSLSMPHTPPVQSIEETSVQQSRIPGQELDGGFISPGGMPSASRSGNIEPGDTAGSMDSSRPRPRVDQGHISDYAGNLNPRQISIQASNSQGSRDEGVNQEDGHDDRIHERKSTRSKSPTSPLSATDDKTETYATDYDEVDEEASGMDVNTGLPPFSG